MKKLLLGISTVAMIFLAIPNTFASSECTWGGQSGADSFCESKLTDSTCLNGTYFCSWSVDHCVAQANLDITQAPYCSDIGNDMATCNNLPNCSWIDVFIPTPGVAGMPTIETSGYNSLLAALGTAMTGIVGFFVDGAALWLTLAGALIVIYFLRKWLRVVKSKSVLWQDTGHTKPKYPKSNV